MDKTEASWYPRQLDQRALHAECACDALNGETEDLRGGATVMDDVSNDDWDGNANAENT